MLSPAARLDDQINEPKFNGRSVGRSVGRSKRQTSNLPTLLAVVTHFTANCRQRATGSSVRSVRQLVLLLISRKTPTGRPKEQQIAHRSLEGKAAAATNRLPSSSSSSIYYGPITIIACYCYCYCVRPTIVELPCSDRTTDRPSHLAGERRRTSQSAHSTPLVGGRKRMGGEIESRCCRPACLAENLSRPVPFRPAASSPEELRATLGQLVTCCNSPDQRQVESQLESVRRPLVVLCSLTDRLAAPARESVIQFDESTHRPTG